MCRRIRIHTKPAWTTECKITLRNIHKEDIPKIIALQRKSFSDIVIYPWFPVMVYQKCQTAVGKNIVQAVDVFEL
jgi:hypothetical protein